MKRGKRIGFEQARARMSLIIYTANVGTRDRVAPRPKFLDPSIRTVLFTDNADRPDGWEVEPLQSPDGLSPRKSARYHKINAHLLFPGELTFWHDASFTLIADGFKEWVRAIEGKDFAFAVCKHPHRSTVSAEANECARLRKDKPEKIRRQWAAYQKAKFPDRSGLYETCCLARRDTAKVAAVQAEWWRELFEHSCRDQISLPYVLWKYRVNPVVIAGPRVTRMPWVRFVAHPESAGG